MTPEELYAKICSLIKPGNTFELRPGDLGSPMVDRLLQFFFSGPYILQNCPTPELDGGVTRLRGDYPGTFRSLTPNHSRINAFIESGVVHIEIVIFSTAGGLFSAIFPGTENSTVGGCTFGNVELMILSRVQAPPYTALQKRVAPKFYNENRAASSCNLQFAGELRLPELLKWVKPWIPAELLRFKGMVELTGNSPRFLLATDEFSPAPLGYLSAGLSLGFMSLYAEVSAEQPLRTMGWTRLAGTLRVSGNPIFPVEALMQEGVPDYIRFNMLIDEVPRMNLDSLKGLLNGTALGPYLPTENFPVISDVSLTRFSVDVCLDPPGLALVEVAVGTPPDKKYDIIPGLLFGEELGIEVSIANAGTATQQIGVVLTAKTRVANTDAVRGYILNRITLPSLAFEVGLGDYSTVDVIQLLKPVLPELPGAPAQLICKEFMISGEPRSGKLSIGSGFDMEWQLGYVTLYEVSTFFTCTYDKSSSKFTEVEAMLGLRATIGEKLDMTLSGGVSKGGWTLSGKWSSKAGITLSDILPAGIELPPAFAGCRFDSLDASIDSAAGKFTLSTRGKLAFDLGDLGNIYGTSFSLSVEKKTTGWTWAVTVEGGFQVYRLGDTPGREWLADIGGTLTINGSPATFTIGFKAADGKGWINDIPLLIPARIENGVPVFSKARFRIAETGLAWDKTKGWSLSCLINFEITDTWAPLKKLLPADGIRLRFRIDKEGALIELPDEHVAGFNVPNLVLPPMGDYPALDLGPSRFSVGKLQLELTRKFEISASFNLYYYLPQHLNLLFGKDAKGDPRFVLFETYDPEKGDSSPSFSVQFFAKVGAKPSIGANIDKIPTKFFGQASDPDYWVINIGPVDERGEGKYGSIWIGKAALSFDLAQGGFTLDAKWDVKKNPEIPLDLLKRLLSSSVSPDLARLLPDSVPVPISNPPKFIEGGELNVGKVNAFFGNKLPDVILRALDQLAKVVKNLPVTLTEYFNVPDYGKMHIRLVITATASVEIQLIAPDPGVKILYIQPSAIPSIQGITLKKFVFGQVFGGAAFKIAIDATFDTFDVVSLGAALLAPESSYPYIGLPKNYMNRLYMQDLLVLVFYQAGVPIPVPLFYEKIGVSYKGIGNTTFESSFEFPMPKINLAELGDFVKNLIKFFTDPKFRMPDAKYEDMKITFSVGPNYFESGLLRTGKIGITEKFTPFDLYKTVTAIMNTAKFFDVEEFVKSLPLDKRVGSVATQVDFICMKLSASWLLTTPAEFVDGKLYEKFLGPGSDPGLFMRILPGKVTVKDRGVLFFLKGTWDTDYSSLSAGFGSIAMNAGRFATGFFAKGNIAGVFNADILAYVKFDPPEKPFELYGTGCTTLNIIGIQIFSGQTTLYASNERFYLDGSFSLISYPPLINIGSRPGEQTGGVVSKEIFQLGGNIELQILIFRFSGTAEISNKGISVGYELAGLKTRLTVREEGDLIHIGGSMPLGLISLATDVYFNRSHLTIKQSSNTIAELITLKITSSADLPSGPNHITIDLFTILSATPVFSASAAITTAGDLYVKSDYSLFPPGTFFNIWGSISGTLHSDGRLDFEGSTNVGVGGLSLGGSIFINNTGIGLQIEDSLTRFTGKIYVYGGKLYLVGSILNKKKGTTAEGYIDDQFPFIHFGRPPGMLKTGKATKPVPASCRLLFEHYDLVRSGLKYSDPEPFHKKRYGARVVHRTRKGEHKVIIVPDFNLPGFGQELAAALRKKLGQKKYAEHIRWKKAELKATVPARRMGAVTVALHLPAAKQKQLRQTVLELKPGQVAEFFERLAGAVAGQIAKIEKPAVKKKPVTSVRRKTAKPVKPAKRKQSPGPKKKVKPAQPAKRKQSSPGKKTLKPLRKKAVKRKVTAKPAKAKPRPVKKRR